MKEEFDPILLQILWSRLISIAQEQAKTLIHASFTTVVGEMEDLATGIYDEQGNIMSQGVTGTQGVLIGMTRGVKAMLKRFPPHTLAPGDVIASFDCGTCLPNRDELEAIGTEGSLFLDDPWHCAAPVIELRRDDGVELIELDPVDSYRLELENLSDAIRGDAALLLARDDAVAQARTIEALFRSAESQAPVTPGS